MSNAWPPSVALAASAIQIRFTRRLREIHLGTNSTDISHQKLKIKNPANCVLDLLPPGTISLDIAWV